MIMVHENPGKIKVEWEPGVQAIVVTWSNYFMTFAEFKEASLKGLQYAKLHGGKAWIVDSSSAKGAFSKEIQAFIGKNIFPTFAKNGIQYFITIVPKSSAITKMTVSQYTSKLGPNGIKLVETNNVAEAVEWLKANL